jgi:presequence protease
MRLLEHEGCGARVLHIAHDDPENLFCLGFRTVPTRSDGVPHILEHTVLCGSKRFPVRDPFFSMTRRSLNTFMNAMTAEDMTYYPAASLVPQDFRNLLEVYLDAVFFPLLDPLSFAQEGHRLGYEGDELQIEGIVFNEMKGALASPEARGAHKMLELLFPDSPYRVNSGGDPAVIPALTHEQLVEFHRTYYHPSRCVFFFSGNQPIEPHLELIEERVLKDAERLPPLPPIPTQKRFSKPIRAEETFPSSGEEMPQLLLAWLTCQTTDELEVLSIAVAEILLGGNDASPLKQALLRSGLCKEMSLGFDADLLDVPLFLTLRGCDDADGVEKLVEETLKRVAKEGLSPDMIEGAIHQLELGRSEIGGGGSPYGLTLFRRSVPLLLHGGNPRDGLEIHTLFDALRKRFEDPAYLGTLIQKYLVDNPHRVTLQMRPDQKRATREIAEEAAYLKTLHPDRKEVEALNAKLQEMQEQEEDLEVLPKVEVSDISREPRVYPLTTSSWGGGEKFVHSAFTNEILYSTLIFKLPPLSDEELPMAQLLVSLLPELGCGGRSYEETLNFVQEHTGGIDMGLDLYTQADDLDQLMPVLALTGKALDRKKERLFQVMEDFITAPDLTDASRRIQELLMQQHSMLEASLPHSALRYAVQLAASGTTTPGYIGHSWSGLRYLHLIRTLVKNPIEQVIEQLTALAERIVGAGTPHLILSSDEEVTMPFPSKEVGQWQFPQLESIPSQGRLISSPVAFTCQMMRGLPYTHADAPALSIASELFGNVTLHKRIREQGGAYGSGATFNPLSGLFYFYSYRDPRYGSTLAAFKESLTAPFSQRNLDEAKLKVIQRLDSPISPGARAMTGYQQLQTGRTPTRRQAFRQALLDLTADQVTEAIATHLQPQIEQAPVITFAEKEFFAARKVDLPLQEA